MIRKAAFILVFAAAPALADSTTTCTRSMLGTFVNCTTSDDRRDAAAVSDGMNSLTAAIIARNAAKRAEKKKSVPAQEVPLADLKTGNGFLAGCSNMLSGENFGLCYGFLQGFVQREWMLGDSSNICIPETVSLKQMMDVINAWLVAHPQDRHYGMAYLAHAALFTAFPCNTQPTAPAAGK